MNKTNINGGGDFGKLEAEIKDYYDHHMVIKSFRTISEDLGFVIQ